MVAAASIAAENENRVLEFLIKAVTFLLVIFTESPAFIRKVYEMLTGLVQRKSRRLYKRLPYDYCLCRPFSSRRDTAA